MKAIKLILLLLFVAALTTGMYGQSSSKRAKKVKTKEETFKFVLQKDAMNLPDDTEKWVRLYELVDEHQSDIFDSRIRIDVVGYSSSIGIDNRARAESWAKMVRSRLMIQKGLIESHFILRSRIVAHEGDSEAVVITLRIPVSG